MASMKKQKGMVFHQEGARTPAGEPPSQYFAVPKSVKPRRSGLEPGLLEISEKEDSMGRASMPQSKAATRNRPGLPLAKHTPTSNLQEENLSAESICRGVKVTLDNNSMWNEFFRCQTEMILTKQGSRMFPYCRFRISGLQPSKKYFLLMDIQPVDNSRYRWTGRSWQAAGKAEHPLKSRPFPHPDSPSTGQRWMQSPVSFYKLKVTNNLSNPDGNVILHPMQRYVPRLHVVQTDKAAKEVRLNGPGVVTFVFAQTEFMAVTSYQNSQFAQLKVDYNPFMKGLKDESNSWGLKLKPVREEGQTEEQHPLRRSLKSLLANHKPRITKGAEPKACKDLQVNPPAKEAPPTLPETRDPCPAQKLFSEMIREAHISLRRCSLEPSDSPSPPDGSKPRSPQSNASVSTSDGMAGQALPGMLPESKGEADAAAKVEENHRRSPNCRGDSAVDGEAGGGAVASDSVRHSSGPSVESWRKPKRPAPVPLPALALFLKQHLAKSKKAASRSEAPPPASPSEAPSSTGVSAAPQSNCVPAESPLEEDAVPQGDRARPDEGVQVFPEQELQTERWPSSPSCPEAGTNQSLKESRTSVLSSITPAEGAGPELAVPEDTAALLPSNSPERPVPMGAPAVVSVQADLSPPGDKAPAPSDALLTDSSSPGLAPDPPAMMPLLPDPECSSFCFESFSPASSPEPLASLACSQAVQLDSVTFEPKAAEEKPQGGASSVFRWHTVMPSHQPYLDSPFSFQPVAQTLSLAPPVLLAPHTPEAHMFVGSTPPPEVALPFQESEHSLPFPAELSPLQLPLSPTFSSLDGGGLSPTPSLTDLVHFFSNDDLGIGLDFSSSEPVAVLCPSPSAREDQRQERSQQDGKRYKHKKPRRHKAVRNGAEVKTCSYTSLQPNLEEVEEQLFVSFTSKVEGGSLAQSQFPDIYREFESLQAQVRRAAHDYIVSPQAGSVPLEVRNIEVARSLGILDEVNRMKVVPGTSPSSRQTHKTARYMEDSKMLPPSKRFKMENSLPVHQNGVEMHKTDGSQKTPETPGSSASTSGASAGGTSVASGTTSTSSTSGSITTVSNLQTSTVKPCSVSVAPLMIPDPPRIPSTESGSSSAAGSTPCEVALTQPLAAVVHTEVTEGKYQEEGSPQDQSLRAADLEVQVKEKETASGSESSPDSKNPDRSSSPPAQPAGSSEPEPSDSPVESSSMETKDVQEGQEIYIQTDGLDVHMSEPGMDRIVIVNGPDGTTMHIQAPEDVPLEAVHALLGIEASNEGKASQ